jgi:hypothetical protein
METSVRKLFERYEQVFNASLHGDVDMDDVAALYASEFIAASPAGVMTGKNDEQLRQAMVQGYARYRAIGTKEMRHPGTPLLADRRASLRRPCRLEGELCPQGPSRRRD